MARNEFVVRLVPVGEPVTGIWCERCALPSVIRCVMAFVSPAGRVLHVGSWEHCTDCPNENEFGTAGP